MPVKGLEDEVRQSCLLLFALREFLSQLDNLMFNWPSYLFAFGSVL